MNLSINNKFTFIKNNETSKISSYRQERSVATTQFALTNSSKRIQTKMSTKKNIRRDKKLSYIMSSLYNAFYNNFYKGTCTRPSGKRGTHGVSTHNINYHIYHNDFLFEGNSENRVHQTHADDPVVVKHMLENLASEHTAIVKNMNLSINCAIIYRNLQVNNVWYNKYRDNEREGTKFNYNDRELINELKL